MAKDLLQLEGDLHVLMENVSATEYRLHERVKDIGRQISDANAANYAKTYQEIVELFERYKTESEAKNHLLLRRVEKLEEYYNEDCFQNLLQELNKLKKEYHKKALKIVHKHSDIAEE